MKGIKFGNYHTYRDFSLILSSWKIEPPKPKKETVEVPGADKPLDFTEFFGGTHYENRKATFEFSLLAPRSEIFRIFSYIQNTLHGKKMKITPDEDEKYYYIGRITINECVIEKAVGKVMIECDCEPYKYRLNKTINTVVVTGRKTVELENLRQHVVPMFSNTAKIDIEFEGERYSISTTGEFTLPEVVLKEGKNIMTISGNATVTISYQEGGL